MGLGVEVKAALLQLLQQDSALAVDDRLGQSRGPRAVEHPERVIERHRLELQRARTEEAVFPARAVQVPEPYDASSHFFSDLVYLCPAVEVLAPIAIAVDPQQHLGLDLSKAIDHAAGAELRSGRGPDGADRGTGQQRRHRLGDVRQIGSHPIAPADAQASQAGGDRRRPCAQLFPRPFA